MDLKILILICLLLKNGMCSAQNTTVIFTPMFGNKCFEQGKKYNMPGSDSIEITVLKFYISNIELQQNGQTVWKQDNSYHLIDGGQKNTMSIALENQSHMEFNQIRFNIGIDSITNHAGAMGGDLDPTLGMYWTWQNGYINFKLEGISPACMTRNNEFQYHIGGYSYPYNTLQEITIPVGDMQKINIDIAIEKILSGINFSKQHHIMSPCNEAVIISKQIAGAFTLKRK